MNHAIAETSTAADRDESTLRELNRVGTAAAMMVIAGTMIIVVMTIMLGHYNSLAHCGPKAVLDGLTLTLLLGRRGRWRLLALLGVVYGLVLVLQVGVVYLLAVMVVAGSMAAVAGWLASRFSRVLAVCLAAVTFELLAGCGAPIRILLATRHGDEPILWMMWFAEWPLRVIGALTGAWLASRWLRNRCDGRMTSAASAESALSPHASRCISSQEPSTSPMMTRRKSMVRRAGGRGQAAIRMVAAMFACFVPVLFESWAALACVATAFILYGWWAGLRRRVFNVLVGLAWGWFIFASASFLWHHDKARTIDLVRSFLLGMCPLAVAAPALILTTRPVDLVRVLRWWRVPAAALIPVAQIARQVPLTRTRLSLGLADLRAQGIWKGPWSVVQHPVAISRNLLGPQMQHWMTALADESPQMVGSPPPRS